MRENRRSSRIEKGFSEVLARLWQGRYALGLAVAYGLLFAWLFSGTGDALDGRPEDFRSIPTRPQWDPPDPVHRFGTTADGTDLYVLSRAAMARTSAIAVVVSAVGVMLGLLLTLLFAGEGADRAFRKLGGSFRRGFDLLLGGSRMYSAVPMMVILCILLGGSGGSPLVTVLSFSLVIALYTCPIVVRWFEEEEARPDRVAATVLGLPSARVMRNRSIPLVAGRLVGLAAILLPGVILAEMSLSFLGFTGGALSCGTIIASGRESLLEAPWVTIYPGIFAGLVVAALSFLGQVANRMLRAHGTMESL